MHSFEIGKEFPWVMHYGTIVFIEKRSSKKVSYGISCKDCFSMLGHNLQILALQYTLTLNMRLNI